MHLSDLSKQQWTYVTAGGAIAGGFATGLLAYSVSATGGAVPLLLGFAVGALLFFLLVALLGSLNATVRAVFQYTINRK